MTTAKKKKVNIAMNLPARVDNVWLDAAEEALRENQAVIDLFRKVLAKEYPPCTNQDENPNGFNLWVFSVYVHCGAIPETVRILTEAGARKRGKTAKKPWVNFTTTDVSDIIRDCTVSDSELNEAAKRLIDRHTDHINRRYN